MRKQSWRDYRIWSASSFAIVVLVCAHLESFGFGATGLLALLVIGAAASGLLSALYGLLRGSQAWRIVGLHLFGVPLLASMLGGGVARYQQRRSFERGDHIATALASYHQVSGFYPRTLSELVPHYLPTVPRSAMGVLQRVPFDYSRDVREGYSLAFAARPTPRGCAMTSWSV